MKILRSELATLVLLWSGAARADEPLEQARALFREGVALYREGELDAAAGRFEQAYGLHQNPATLCNLGVVQHQLGRSVDAANSLALCLAESNGIDPLMREQAAGVLAELRPRIARLRVEGVPPGAAVFVDGREVSAGVTRYVAGGAHVVEASLGGYVTASREVRVADGEEIAVRIPLVRRSTLVVTSPLRAVSVSVDGRRAGTTPLASGLSLDPGSHEVRCERAGYAALVKEVEVAPGASVELGCALAPQPRLEPTVAGKLAISAEDEVEVTIDGAPLPPTALVPPGPHLLVARREGFSPHERWIDLRAGETLSLSLELQPTEEYVAAYVEASRRQRAIAYAVGGVGAAAGVAAIAVAAWNEQRFSRWEEEQRMLDQAFAATAIADERLPLRNRQDENDALFSSIAHADGAAIGLAVGSALVLAVATTVWLLADDPNRYDGLTDGQTAWRGPW